ncbi:hypothetical protein [Sphingomonas sp.]|uniref:hypothetical protein n=1 Tax=Sphingomonas sp. TaxID=28214 RepID=UPI001B10906C|nr:hypothetical protein [Sphingomonas sp.]MBO9711462.1 hypothetical protein [Sphingomonas sp.]
MTAMIRAADGTGRLLVRCDTASVPIVSIQFLPKPGLPAMDLVTATATFDEAMAINSTWQVVGGGAYNAEVADVWDMVNRIAKAKTIRLTIVKPDDSVTESTFVGPGDDSKFRQVYAACGIPFETPPVPVNPKPR